MHYLKGSYIVKLLVAAGFIGSLGGCLKDIRPPELLPQVSDAQLETRKSHGRSLLEAAAEAHGGVERWMALQTTEVVMTDRWHGLARMFNPWPDSDVRVRLEFANGTFDSRCTFLHEDDAGLVWGVQRFTTYTREDGGPVRFEQDDDILFMLPTIQYFTAAPFRLLEAPIILAAGEATIDSSVYDLVYVTWGSFEANKEYDQYVVYIHRATGRIEKLHYTVRDMTPFIVGTIHYSDFREVDGFVLPFDQKVTGAVTDDDVVHQMLLEKVVFNNVDRSVLYPDPSKARTKHP